ncbi:D-alanyl-D-alanine carboxypeptidase/D-alanyl-D-alanine-endopeptidase [Vandammella animalimorsus]|uniref:D-alanyl-D-alanine carboxypeptidase/D-alanyl-D-alanine-endopeptidase n=1 Tax=Vandammella animalimorsus TaxID=2029117 RepID=A0A2A2ALH2_9BURK|nr:D-alanyl-D-alanine carboxypeptidase/D-alanyl-D-alanine-endopeptidase [Vandammella animalimorsus]PAT39425.1 D-alanyl-D-alanine carboxypeptidase/D-alanyl-D-alanine-endopeptidase [Vandammella animalimorsus]
MPQRPPSCSRPPQAQRHGAARQRNAAALALAAGLALGLALLATPPAQAQASGQDQGQIKTAAPQAQTSAPAASLPAPFAAALRKAQIPPEAVALWVQAVDGQATPRAAHRAAQPMSPASTMKLVTTYAALDRLGPAYTWKTRIYTDGQLDNGSLRGNVYIQGGGDPKLVMERLWLLLRQLQQHGVRVVLGDIVLDRSAFALPPHNAAAFDDEPLRPYNAAPDALLLNFKSVILRFVPDPASGRAQVQLSPPMAQLELPASVPLNPTARHCPSNWRAQLQLDVSQPGRWRLGGSYPSACGALNWAVAYPDPEGFANKAIEGMWRELGGSITGQVRSGRTPGGLQPWITEPSLSLAEIVRDVNKYSNNVMADHVFLALGHAGAPAGQAMDFASAQRAIGQWWHSRIGNPPGTLHIDNGSGLSRDARITAQAMGQMLRHAWHSPVMPELVASLPATGVDGTMRRSRAAAAHLKTGSLRDVNALAGYVHGHSGKRYALVVIINHANAAAARGAAFDALIDWVAND